MKLPLSFALLLYVGLVFSQSKKEQIEQLTLRVDSLNSVLRAERNSNALKITSLENSITQLNAKIVDYTAQITSLNAQVSTLTSDVQTNKAATARKQQELQALQAQLKVKQDSLTLVNAELLKLKPPVKPVVATTPTPASTTPSGPYKTVTIGAQVWMAANLNVSTFRNGDAIPQVTSDAEWEAAGENKQPAWCYYDNDAKNGTKYGKLYNWYAVNDPRGLAPAGYHVPTDAEWTTLDNFLGDDAGKKMKSTSGWESWSEDLVCTNCKNWNAEYRKKTACHVCKDTRVHGTKAHSGNGTNSSGFSGLPGGYRYSGGTFSDQGYFGYWWSASENDTDYAYYRNLLLYGGNLYRYNGLKEGGFSVRCLRD
jgi:uncharacterized protein (TIGR02145 family)